MYKVELVRALPYNNRPECLLDFYLPQTGKASPALVYFHGGGLETGERQDEEILLRLASEYGIAVATVDYRMYPAARYPDFIEDCADAVAFVLDYNKRHGLFHSCYVGGTSAGAYLAMMLCFARGFLEKRGVAPEEIAGYVFDAGQPTVHFNVLRERGLDTRLVRIDEAAPLWYIDRDFPHPAAQPRLLLVYSDGDMVNRAEQNELLYRTLSHFGYDMGRVEKVCMKGFSHVGYYGAQDEAGTYLFPKLFADFILKDEQLEPMDGRIADDLRKSCGLTFRDCTPVRGGWLNRKWKITPDGGQPLLVKQFSRERFTPEKLEATEAALQRHIRLEQDGFPCPRILTCDNRAIRLLEDGTAYMVMAFLPGSAEGPGSITPKQMQSLGSVCGRMHRALSRLPCDSAKGYPIDSRRVIDSLWAEFRARLEEDSPGAPETYRRALLAEEPILKTMTPEFLDRLPKGLAHEDFTPDNLLFDEEGVTAVLDFDRSSYSFLWHDVARAVLSFALHDGQLELEKIRAFAEGYSEFYPLALPDIADALRVAWCIETPWWIQPEFFTGDRGKTVRFRDEIRWVTEHWFELDSLLAR